MQSSRGTDRECLPLIFQSNDGIVYGKAYALTNQECKAFIEVVGFRGKLSDMEQKAIYFRGSYDSVGYLKKREFYNQERRHGL